MLGAVTTGSAAYALSDEEKFENMKARISHMQVSSILRMTAAVPPVINIKPTFDHLQSEVRSIAGLNCRADLNECQFSDHNLAGAMDRVDKGIASLMKKYPGRPKPQVKSGLRGPKYYIELPIVGHNVDAFGLVISTEAML